MAPIPFENAEMSSNEILLVALVGVIFGVGTALVSFLCGGKNKEDEPPPAPPPPPPPPAAEPPPTGLEPPETPPDGTPPPPQEDKKSGKSNLEPPKSANVSLMMKEADDLQLMSRVDDNQSVTTNPNISTKKMGDLPSLKLMESQKTPSFKTPLSGGSSKTATRPAAAQSKSVSVQQQQPIESVKSASVIGGPATAGKSMSVAAGTGKSIKSKTVK